jgi:hypothetical protein
MLEMRTALSCVQAEVAVPFMANNSMGFSFCALHSRQRLLFLLRTTSIPRQTLHGKSIGSFVRTLNVLGQPRAEPSARNSNTRKQSRWRRTES